jgi:hypothetical protein
VQMIDTSTVRVHQHGACIAGNRKQQMGRSRGGLTSKIHAVVDTNGLPVHLGLTSGEAHDNRLRAIPLKYGFACTGHREMGPSSHSVRYVLPKVITRFLAARQAVRRKSWVEIHIYDAMI